MSLRTTALNPLHHELGGKMVDFAGWELPLHYSGILAEHKHTRTQASLFDVSHMGQVLIHPLHGEVTRAAEALESLTPASVIGLDKARQRYGLFTDAAGGILDDLMFAHHGTHFFLVVNAARTEHDLTLLRNLPGIRVEHLQNRALLALQGPTAVDALATLIPSVCELRFMDSVQLGWDDAELWVSRSGYTGEDGFEISVPQEAADPLARALLAMDWVSPAGLGARDSLRLEAGMPLYGHDLSQATTPAEAGLGWSIPKVRRRGGSREGGFPGAEIILAQLTEGPSRVRMGLRPEGRTPIREGVRVFAEPHAQDAEPIAVVSSGGFGATIGGPVAMAMLPTDTKTGSIVYGEVRGKRIPLTVTALPFISPSYKR